MRECCWPYMTEVNENTFQVISSSFLWFLQYEQDSYFLFQRLSWRYLTTVWQWLVRRVIPWSGRPTVYERGLGSLRLLLMTCRQKLQPGLAGLNHWVGSTSLFVTQESSTCSKCSKYFKHGKHNVFYALKTIWFEHSTCWWKAHLIFRICFSF